jgi:DNA-binding transcriptional LysR family regulator
VLHPALEALPWRDDALLLCAPPTHPLARRRTLVANDLADETWVIREPGSATRALSEQVLGQLPPVRSRLELSQTEAIKQAVVAGLGIALLPEVAIRNELQAGQLRALRTPFLRPFLQRKLWLLLHRDRYRGALLETFLRATNP